MNNAVKDTIMKAERNTHQKLGHVKSQILDKAEWMLSHWSHASQAGGWLLRAPTGSLGG